MLKADSDLIEQISYILVRENQITYEEQLRILELLGKEKADMDKRNDHGTTARSDI